MRTFVVILLCSCLASPCAKADSLINSQGLNDEGVRALKSKQWNVAFARLEAALKLAPGYRTARTNLMTAHNNRALEFFQEGKTEDAIDEFHKSLATEDNATTARNLDGLLRKLGENPSDFAVRVAMGNRARDKHDYLGAMVEYKQALKIREDERVRGFLKEMSEKVSE